MPQLVGMEEVKVEWDDIRRRHHHPWPQSEARTPGWHLSHILRYIAIQSGILNVDSTRPGEEVDEDVMPLRMAMGMAFEEWMAGLYPEMMWQPGEVYRDQVYGSLDGLTETDCDGLIVEEFKLTWKSLHTYGSKDQFVQHNWLWMRQVMGYLAMLDSKLNNTARFHIGWVNGDYRPSQPRYFRYTVRFTERELEQGWRLVMKNRDKVKKEG